MRRSDESAVLQTAYTKKTTGARQTSIQDGPLVPHTLRHCLCNRNAQLGTLRYLVSCTQPIVQLAYLLRRLSDHFVWKCPHVDSGYCTRRWHNRTRQDRSHPIQYVEAQIRTVTLLHVIAAFQYRVNPSNQLRNRRVDLDRKLFREQARVVFVFLNERRRPRSRLVWPPQYNSHERLGHKRNTNNLIQWFVLVFVVVLPSIIKQTHRFQGRFDVSLYLVSSAKRRWLNRVLSIGRLYDLVASLFVFRRNDLNHYLAAVFRALGAGLRDLGGSLQAVNNLGIVTVSPVNVARLYCYSVTCQCRPTRENRDAVVHPPEIDIHLVS